jgi:hypothetical protein
MRVAALLLAIGVATAACTSSDVSRSLGARCDSSDECDDRCLAPGTDWPGGMCTESCDDDADCPGDARCAADEGGVCLFECTAPAQCEFLGAGWTCVARDGRPSGQVMVCRGQ